MDKQTIRLLYSSHCHNLSYNVPTTSFMILANLISTETRLAFTITASQELSDLYLVYTMWPNCSPRYHKNGHTAVLWLIFLSPVKTCSFNHTCNTPLLPTHTILIPKTTAGTSSSSGRKAAYAFPSFCFALNQ